MKGRWIPLGILLITPLVLMACGKKGPPLPPLLRVPSAPEGFIVTRIEDNVYAQFASPKINVDGVGPADVARVELYAITADRLPEGIEPDDLRKLSTLIGSQQVRRPVPPPPEGAPPMPPPAASPGVDQGAVIVMLETLTPATRTPVELPEPDLAERASTTAEPYPRPLVAPPESAGPQRYYYVVAVNSRGRYGPASHLAPVPFGPTSSAPPAPEITVQEKSMTIRWKHSSDARGIQESPPEGVLPSRSIVEGPPSTTYDVYEVRKDPPPANATPTLPTPLTPAPLGALELSQPTSLGSERCFVVRPVDIIAGTHVRGPASPIACAPFADTFAPAPPGRLDTAVISGQINLIWEPSPAADLAGYIVLRSTDPNATLTALNTQPTTNTTYADDTVQPGVRYIYAVVAVDKAGNRSAESNRAEETARE